MDTELFPNAVPTEPRALYLDLMKRSLLNWIYADAEAALHHTFSVQQRETGQDWPPTAHTMIGRKRLENVQYCVETVLKDNIPGDLCETGVWRGGATIFMRAVLQAFGVVDRTVWVADSFAGLPPPNPDKYPADVGLNLHLFPQLAISLEKVQAHFARYGLLDGQVKFLKGWFKDTLPTAPIQKLAVLRLDGDLYESTMDAITALYPKLTVGGFLIVDDYGAVVACQRAADDYRRAHGITEPIHQVDWTGVWWRRER